MSQMEQFRPPIAKPQLRFLSFARGNFDSIPCYKNMNTNSRLCCASFNRAFSLVLVNLLLLLPLADAFATEPECRLSNAQKGVKVSTDVFLVALPTAAVVGTLCMRDWEGLKEGAFTAVATVGATYLLKYTVREWRPDHSDRHSFPSGHTSVTFASASYLQRRYGWIYGVPAYALAAYTGWGRVYARRHHWWDVVAGAAIGTGSAYLFAHPWARRHQLNICPVADGESMGFAASFVF